MSSNPQIAMIVFDQIPNEVVAQASGIVGVVFVYDEGVSVVTVEAFAGGKPHEAAVILQNRNNVVLSQAIVGGEVGKFEVPHPGRAALSWDILKLAWSRVSSWFRLLAKGNLRRRLLDTSLPAVGSCNCR
jgi:hypothetical protein